MAGYNNVRKIGEGGFGSVWICERDADGEVFAKKIAFDNLGDDAVARFAREVRILGSLDHPNVVKIIGRRLLKKPLFYVMPLYKQSLAAELPNLIANESRIAGIMGAVLDGVEYAHGQGVLHRDLNPRNVLMNSDSDVVISDFGLGLVVDSESTRRTLTGFGMGTMFYMAPEQMDDAKRADARADVYSLGRMIYELYTGPLRSLHRDVARLPPGIAHIVTRSTQPDPDLRFQTVSDLKRAWTAYFDVAIREAGRGQLQTILAEVSSTGRFEGEQAFQLVELLQQNREDTDLIHEILMKLPAPLIADLWKVDRGGMKMVLWGFFDLVAGQSWGFSYTDTIADHTRNLFSLITEPALRAWMVIALVRLGIRHNRWHVLDAAVELFYAMQTDAELGELGCFLGQLSKRQRWEFAERLKESRVRTDLWQILTEDREPPAAEVV